MAIGKYLKAFASYTTMHGFSRIIDSNATSKRLAWIIVFTTAWIFFTIQMSLVLQEYFKYAKKLTTDIVLGGVPFPAITLCNLGSFDFYTVYRLSQGLASLQEQYEAENKTDEEVSEEKDVPEQNEDISVASNKYLNDTFIRALYKYYRVERTNSTSLNDNHAQIYNNKMFSRTTLAANLPTTMLSANGVQEVEFIVRCTFRNKPCRFKKIFDPYFFNCYTFTAPNVTSTAGDETTPLFEGIENGFSVVLLAGTRMLKEVTNPDERGMPGIYAKDNALSGAGGVRVVIHRPGTKPYPLTEGFDVPPGHMASLGITPKRRKRLDQPYGHCNKKYPFLSPEEQQLAEHYRKTACEKVCIQNHIYRKCNCYENTLPNEIDLLADDDVDDALSSNELTRTNIARKKNSTIQQQDECFTEKHLEEERNGSRKDACKRIEKCSGTMDFRKCFKFYSPTPPTCNDEVLRDLVEKIECAESVKDHVMGNATLLSQCGCHPACDDLLYDVSYSLSQWPSQGIDGNAVAYEIMTELNYIERFTSKEKKEYYDAYVKKDLKRALKDFSKINVYVSDANVLLTTEEPAMTSTQLICDIGGQLGVWIGVSVITIAEVLEIFILIVMDFCRERSEDDNRKEVKVHMNAVATE